MNEKKKKVDEVITGRRSMIGKPGIMVASSRSGLFGGFGMGRGDGYGYGSDTSPKAGPLVHTNIRPYVFSVSASITDKKRLVCGRSVYAAIFNGFGTGNGKGNGGGAKNNNYDMNPDRLLGRGNGKGGGGSDPSNYCSTHRIHPERLKQCILKALSQKTT